MTSSNGNIFRVTGPLCVEFTAQRRIPHTKASDAELWLVCVFDLRLNKRLSEQSWGWWFETPSRWLWRHCNQTPVKLTQPIIWLMIIKICSQTKHSIQWSLYTSVNLSSLVQLVACRLFGVKPIHIFNCPGTNFNETLIKTQKCFWTRNCIWECRLEMHYSDVAMTIIASQIACPQLFVQPFVYADVKDVKARVTGPFWGEFTGVRWIFLTEGQSRRKCFHLMTS